MTDRAVEARQRAAETKRRRTRVAVIAAAERLFDQRGWVQTTMEAIASEAGVGAATVYNHFPTKNALAAWALRPRFEDLLDPAVFDDLTAADAVDRYLDDLCVRSRRHRHLLTAFLQSVTDAADPIGRQVAADDPRSILPLVTTLEALIARGQATGEFAADPGPNDTALMLVQATFFRVLTRHPEDPAETSALFRTWAKRVLTPA